MWLITKQIKQQLGDWTARGLLTEAQAATLASDLDQRPAPTFGYVAAMLGAVCICFAAMTFVAANWDGAIMFVSQMYHLTGPPTGGVLLWSIGTLAAAFFLRSVPALCLGVALATLWAAWEIATSASTIHFWYLPLWASAALLAWILRSRFSAHLCALGLLVWLFAYVVQSNDSIAAPVVVAAGFVGIALLLWSAGGQRFLRGYEIEVVPHMLALIYAFGALWWADSKDVNLSIAFLVLASAGILLCLAVVAARTFRFDIALCALWIAVLAVCVFFPQLPFVKEILGLGVSIWIIRMARRIGMPRLLPIGYLGFAAVMLTIYLEAAEGLLGTSVFYFGAGVLLLAGTWLLPKVLSVLPNGEAR